MLTGVREEQLRAGQAQRHPQEMAEAAGPEHVHAFDARLGVGGQVETDGTEEARKTEQMVAVKVRDEHLADAT